MPLANWKEEYETGYAPVDSQHKHLFGMVNELHEGIVGGSTREILLPLLRTLEKYTVEHFQTEESLMSLKSYPGFIKHKKIHNELARRVADLVTQYAAGETVLPLTLSRFLADWIEHHIQEEDKALIDWLRKKG